MKHLAALLIALALVGAALAQPAPCGFTGDPPQPWWVIRFGSDPPEYLPCPGPPPPTPLPTRETPTSAPVEYRARQILIPMLNGSEGR